VSRLIALSGLDGSGKTTLAHALLGSLTEDGIRAEELTMGPSRVWRWTEILGDLDPSLARLFSAERCALALNFERFEFALGHLLPALALNDCVIAQRFALDWAATGRAFGAPEFEVPVIQAFLKLTAAPVLMVYIDVPPHVADERLRRRGRSSSNREHINALMRTHRAYEELLDHFPDTMRLDGTCTTARQVELLRARLVAEGVRARSTATQWSSSQTVGRPPLRV
jgi:dTMP kinase